MKWSYKFGKLLGIDLYVHITFFMLLAWILFSDLTSRGNMTVALIHLALLLITFAIVIMHELGHSMAARKLGIPTRDINLLPIGGMARLERMPEKPSQELFVALSGPAVNLALIVIFGAIRYLYSGQIFTLDWGNHQAGLVDFFLHWLIGINGGLLLFNLVPAFPMDGGRVLRALLGFKFDYLKATEIAYNVARVIAVLFFIAGFKYGLMLTLIAVFVWYGGRTELNMVRQREMLKRMAAQRAKGGAHGPMTITDLLMGIAGGDRTRVKVVPGPLGWQVQIDGSPLGFAEGAAFKPRRAPTPPPTGSDDPFENVKAAAETHHRQNHDDEAEEEPRARIVDIE